MKKAYKCEINRNVIILTQKGMTIYNKDTDTLYRYDANI